MHLRENQNYSIFKLACELTGVDELLNQIGYFNFTVFAPTDQAFIDAGLDGLTMPIGEMESLIKRHIIQRKIFTDGSFIGVINTVSDENVTIGGSWSSFNVKFGNMTAIPLDGQMNLQANNGVVHGISVILQ